MHYKLSFPTQKRILIGLLVVWAFAVPLGMTAIWEVISGIKYAPVSSFFLMVGIGATYNLLPLFFALRRALPATRDPHLMAPVLIGMLLPIPISAAPHYINTALASPEVYNVSAPIAEKSRMRRTPRGGDSFLIYKLHLQFDNTTIDDDTLNGRHIIFVPKETYDTVKVGDTFDISLQNGPLAPFMLQTDTTLNMMR